MAKKFINWKTKGMNQDMSVSAFNPEFSFENINLRLSTNEGNTMMSWVNERGTKPLTLKIKVGSTLENDYIRGTVIGTATINHKLVVFSVYESDTLIRDPETGLLDSEDTKEQSYYIPNCFIYVFKAPKDGIMEGELFYQSDLGFDSKHPIETLTSYESEDIQKVYWTDNKNQPRFANIVSHKYIPKYYSKDYFNFVPEVDFNTTVNIEHIYGSGEFPPGVIQYAFTRYNKNGQESCIFYTSPLHYITYINRGAKPGDKIGISFKITINNIVSSAGYEYIRVYSILRTSKDSTPLVKRVRDINISEINATSATLIDTGIIGDTVDPTELLYKGGEDIIVKTINQKDGTLFLGNIQNKVLNVKDYALKIKTYFNNIANYFTNGILIDQLENYTESKIESILDDRKLKITTEEPILYINTLTSEDGATGFKAYEYYRLGFQLQYKTGKWSEPIWIGDFQEKQKPIMEEEIIDNKKTGYYTIKYPGFKFTLGNGMLIKANGVNIKNDILNNLLFKSLYKDGYRAIRPLFAVPSIADRTILLQGITCPTMYRKATQDTLAAQSSWLFRYKNSQNSLRGPATDNGGYVYGETSTLPSQYETAVYHPLKGDTIISPYLRNTEVMGVFDEDNRFKVNYDILTLHSPDITFDTFCNNLDFSGYMIRNVGYVELTQTYGDIEIQTSTPPINSVSPGFIHKPIKTDGNAALISGLFYSDFLVDDLKDERYRYWQNEKYPVYFPVYMWHRKASLNNDIERTNRSAQILKKKISNYRVGKTIYNSILHNPLTVKDMDLFNSDELSIIKVSGKIYMGNINDGLLPTENSPIYICGNPVETDKKKFNAVAKFEGNVTYRLTLADSEDINSDNNLDHLRQNNTTKVWSWVRESGAVGDYTRGLCVNRDIVNIKYKSTPHIVIDASNISPSDTKGLPLVEIVKDYDENTFMGGRSNEVLQAHTWIPCGPIVSIDKDTEQVELYYKWGDTYFQQYECLKTYPFTNEDLNQVIEIASFMCETRVNIDGRYDRNRGMISNLNISPTNFNLFNPVYSQLDNFFNYRILDESVYSNTVISNQITWTKTKESGADIDLWTNITLANVLELDGDKGNINKLVRLNDRLLCFQDKGIAQILYNENTQISTTEGVPIEIANSQKVQGKRYMSDTIGCSNKWSIVQTPAGIYFMDSNEKSIYLLGEGLSNLSMAGGFNTWCKQHIFTGNEEWNPKDFGDFKAIYDQQNQEVLFINKDTALAYSEKFNCFTSFYDYGNAPFFENIDGVGIWIQGNKLWQHQSGDYCKFFGKNKPYSMTLVANQDPQIDKIFTNLEFRACITGDGTYNEELDKFSPSLPFDSIEAWDEYQHGILKLSNKNKDNTFAHGLPEGILSRKFRIWRCDIPRDNAPLNATIEAPLGIKRFKVKSLDRIRNTWAYIKLNKSAVGEDNSLSKTEIHDIMISYFA